MGDPGVYFAAERTLLAWVRTGLTIMAMGFVVARFGLFLKILTASVPSAESHYGPWLSTTLGTSLVVLGSIAISVALKNHRSYVKTLPPEDIPGLAAPGLTSFLASSVAVGGLLLALYLVLA